MRKSSREKVFEMLAGTGAGEHENVLDLAPQGKSPDRNYSQNIGDFYYSSFTIGEDISVEMVKYGKPRNINNDGLVFRVTHKNVSYLLFGDFDDPEGIDRLLDILAIYEIKCDVIKWPHHAHKFRNSGKTDNIIRKMNEIIAPVFIIWERHFTQKGFAEYIERFDFKEKFLRSDETEIVIISTLTIEHFLSFG
jgi:SAM-dependent methyltransferase